jgi:hypothetical protein
MSIIPEEDLTRSDAEFMNNFEDRVRVHMRDYSNVHHLIGFIPSFVTLNGWKCSNSPATYVSSEDSSSV